MGDAGGAVSKWEMFVWILDCFMVHSLASVYTKSAELGQVTNLNVIFYVALVSSLLIG